MSDITQESLSFAARDGRDLGGTFFTPQREPSLGVLIAPATGVRQHLYFAIAEEIARRGATALVFDFRDIGASRGDRPLARSQTLKQHWGQLDMPAALDQLADRAPDTPLALLGHSAGGQLVGLMPEVDRLSRIAQVSSSTGYVGHIAGATRPLAWFMLEIYIPATCALLGYTPTQITGWGEDLPEGVARQWAEWCTEPGYVSNAFGRSIARHYYDEIRCPLLNLRCSDDPIATEANVDDLLRLFPGAEIERIVIRPEDYGLDEIGHIDLFRRRCRATWEPLLDWIFEDVDG